MGRLEIGNLNDAAIAIGAHSLLANRLLQAWIDRFPKPIQSDDVRKALQVIHDDLVETIKSGYAEGVSYEAEVAAVELALAVIESFFAEVEAQLRKP